MDFWSEFKKSFRNARDIFPGELWIVLIVIVFLYALIVTFFAVRKGKKLRKEQEKSRLYQEAVLKQEGAIKALEADSERDEYLKNLKRISDRE